MTSEYVLLYCTNCKLYTRHNKDNQGNYWWCSHCGMGNIIYDENRSPLPELTSVESE